MFYTDKAAFEAAVAAWTLVGTTDWSGSTLPANSLQDFKGPILNGVAAGPFPAGHSIPGMTVQDNTDHTGDTASPTPPFAQHSRGMATASAGAYETPDDQVSNAGPGDGFDMLFAPEVHAVSFTPLFFSAYFAFSWGRLPGAVTVKVFDGSQFAGEIELSGLNYTAPDSQFLGIVDTDGFSRIALVTGLGKSGTFEFGGNYSGADNIKVYTQ